MFTRLEEVLLEKALRSETRSFRYILYSCYCVFFIAIIIYVYKYFITGSYLFLHRAIDFVLLFIIITIFRGYQSIIRKIHSKENKN